MTTVKTVQANYTEAQVLSIVTAYKSGEPLENIAKSVGKSVPSVRAKLASLKVYVSKAKKDDKPAEKVGKENKDTLAGVLVELVGSPLLNIEAASKAALLTLINAIKSRDEKIQSLIDDMLGDESEASDEASDSSDV